MCVQEKPNKSIKLQNLPLQPIRQVLKPPAQSLLLNSHIIQYKRNNIPIDPHTPLNRQIINQPHKLRHPNPQLADLQVRQTTLLGMRMAEIVPLPVPRRIDGTIACELQIAVDEVGSGLRFVGPEDGAVAVQEDGGDFAGVGEALWACVLEGQWEFGRHCEVDVPDDGEEGGGSRACWVDAEVGLEALAEGVEAGAEGSLGGGRVC